MTARRDDQATRREFREAVNMTPAELEKWLRTEESRAVGATAEGGHESVGHRSGRHIVSILRSKVGDLGSADYAHMREVIGYVHRHRAQRPRGDIKETPWRYSLMNWGHDPAKAS